MAKSVKKLKFQRIIDFNLIPKKYFKQLGCYEPDDITRIYQFGMLFTKSPTTLLFVAIDEGKVVKGFLWASVDIVDRTLYIRAYSLDKEYQQTGRENLEKARNALHEAIKGSIVKKKVTWLTEKPAAFIRYGGKKSKFTLIEFEDEENVQDNKPDNEQSESADSSGKD
jgi:hypothetical protein|tara:strand:+ start:1807 stop:2310 length:504 start_codon:yes stop_codon:yes gene_type:complete